MEKQLISDVKSQKTKSPRIVGFISKVGEIFTGNKPDGSQYKKQNVTVTDNSGSIELTLWGDDCGLLGHYAAYDIEGFLKEYNGNVSLQKGKYGKITPCEKSDMLDVPFGTLLAPPTTSQPTKEIQEQILAESIEYAKKITGEFIDYMLEKDQIAAIQNAASVWNTAMIQSGKQ